MSTRSNRNDQARGAFLNSLLEYALSGFLGLAASAAFLLLCLTGLLSFLGVMPKAVMGLMALIFMALVFWMVVAE